MNKLAALALVAFVAFTTGCASTTSNSSINFAIAAEEKNVNIDRSSPSVSSIGADPSDPTSWTVTDQSIGALWHAPDTTVPATRAAANKATHGVKLHN